LLNSEFFSSNFDHSLLIQYRIHSIGKIVNEIRVDYKIMEQNNYSSVNYVLIFVDN
jgi:hypothetical protein